MDEVDDKLLEQQEQEQEQQQEEHDNLGSQFEAGGNGSKNDTARITDDDSDDYGNNRNKKMIELAFKKSRRDCQTIVMAGLIFPVIKKR